MKDPQLAEGTSQLAATEWSMVLYSRLNEHKETVRNGHNMATGTRRRNTADQTKVPRTRIRSGAEGLRRKRAGANNQAYLQ